MIEIVFVLGQIKDLTTISDSYSMRTFSCSIVSALIGIFLVRDYIIPGIGKIEKLEIDRSIL